jgi:DNA-binding MarR family transcriptional regulator
MVRADAASKAGQAASPAEPSSSPGAANLELRAWLRLLACTNLMLARLRGTLAGFDVTLPTFDILVQINRPPLGPTMGELSKRLMVSKGSVTDLIERLEKRDFVVRQQDRHDGRVQHVYLTAKAARLLDRVIPAHDAQIEQAMAGLGRDDLEALHGALGELKAGLRLPEGRKPQGRRDRRRPSRNDTGEEAIR